MKIIMGIQLEKRQSTADKVQKLLTSYGCYINARLGLHSASSDYCSEKGLIILEFINDAEDKSKELKNELANINGVIVKEMQFID